jgi:ABC-type transporter Mla MlaB component
MVMDNAWSRPGQVTVTRERSYCTVRIAGNFHRDLATTQRDALEARVRGASDATGLLVNLSDLVRLDSWGEGVIADLVDEVIAGGGRAAIVYDGARPHHVRSLRVLLKRHGAMTRFGDDAVELDRWLTEEA